MSILGLGFFFFTLIILGIFLLPTIFYLLTLQRALEKCAPQNRTMSPGLVWLEIIPLFGLIWQFVNVNAISRSLGNEFRARRIPAEENPGQTLGLWMCACTILIWIPFISWAASIAGLVLFIVYWVKVAGFSARLDRPQLLPLYGQTPQQGPGPSPGHGRPHPSDIWSAQPDAYCPKCGAATRDTDDFCGRCGTDLRGSRRY